MSCVIKISYKNKSFLFTGDIQGDSEQDVIDCYGVELDADVLKVAHHGSASSTSEEFVQAVSPDYAVICVGPNIYGHPSFSTISRLEDGGAKVLTTMTNSVRFVCGDEMFGVIDKNVVHSFEFVDWWVIATVIIVVLISILMKLIVQEIIKRKQKEV